MRSMTGYGKGIVCEHDRTLTIELKAVNNRYLEINSRLPKSLAACDEIVRRNISKQINRGSIDVYFNYENQSEDSRSVCVDMNLVKEYCVAAQKLKQTLLVSDEISAYDLLRLPEVMKVDVSKEDPEILLGLTQKCIQKAIDELNKMRDNEGLAMQKDLNKLSNNVSELLSKVVLRAPLVVLEYREKIKQRMAEILQNVAIDENRLLNEVAFFADKADINEEIARLNSHLEQFKTFLYEQDAQGRKLDFLAQEMNREINTIGSKSNDIELTGYVVKMKNELEKIKEQIRNVE